MVVVKIYKDDRLIHEVSGETAVVSVVRGKTGEYFDVSSMIFGTGKINMILAAVISSAKQLAAFCKTDGKSFLTALKVVQVLMRKIAEECTEALEDAYGKK